MGNKIKVLFELCEKGTGEKNEDIIGYCDNYVWVIDGATDVFKKGHLKKQNEVSWYVEKLNSMIKSNCYLDLKPSQLIFKTISDLYLELNEIKDLSNVPEYELPTFAVSMIKMKDKKIEYYLLGDCSIYFYHENEITRVTDERIQKFVEFNKKEIKRKGLDPRTDLEALEIYRATRKNANQKNGYYIGSIRGTGVQFGIEGATKAIVGDKVLLHSDGIDAYISTHCNALKEMIEDENLGDILADMNAYYIDETIFLKDARPKQVDDKSIILIKV